LGNENSTEDLSSTHLSILFGSPSVSTLAHVSREKKSAKINSPLHLFGFSLAHLLVKALAPGSREMESTKITLLYTSFDSLWLTF
jgi:hypothetical protein